MQFKYRMRAEYGTPPSIKEAPTVDFVFTGEEDMENAIRSVCTSEPKPRRVTIIPEEYYTSESDLDHGGPKQ